MCGVAGGALGWMTCSPSLVKFASTIDVDSVCCWLASGAGVAGPPSLEERCLLLSLFSRLLKEPQRDMASVAGIVAYVYRDTLALFLLMCTIISQTRSHSQQGVTRHHNTPYYFQTYANELSLEILYRCPFSNNDKNVQAASHHEYADKQNCRLTALVV